MLTYPRRLTEDVTILGNRYFSVYLVQRGDSYTLIECGISSIAEQVVRQIRSINIDASKIQDLILTHAHADHITGAPVLKKAMPWLNVKTTSQTKDLLSKEKIQALFLKDDRDIHNRLLELNAVNNARDARLSLKNVIDETIGPVQLLEGGVTTLEVLDAPGHCKGGIALWQPKSKVLFCSDYLGFYLPPDRFVTNFYVDYDAYLETFEFLSGLEPAWICPGHCGAYGGKDARNYINLSRAELRWVYDYVVDRCQSSGRIETAKEVLFNRYYVGEATMFSRESTRYCTDLLIGRISSSKTRPVNRDIEGQGS
jgi:glyoxylase-like metal-dependent hydrolase (beta-lactamase superfamily II)